MKKINNEKVLKILANIILISGIISFFILFFIFVFERSEILTFNEFHELVGTGEYSINFEWIWFGISIGITFLSILFWSFLSVICNISNNLKK